MDQLVGAREADPDRGFMARTMALCSLPRSNPGTRLQYKRVNGPFTLYMVASGDNKLPYGNFPRLILAWISTEAVRTQSRELVLGRSLAKFMLELGVYSSGLPALRGVYTARRSSRPDPSPELSASPADDTWGSFPGKRFANRHSMGAPSLAGYRLHSLKAT